MCSSSLEEFPLSSAKALAARTFDTGSTPTKQVGKCTGKTGGLLEASNMQRHPLAGIKISVPKQIGCEACETIERTHPVEVWWITSKRCAHKLLIPEAEPIFKVDCPVKKVPHITFHILWKWVKKQKSSWDQQR